MSLPEKCSKEYLRSSRSASVMTVFSSWKSKFLAKFRVGDLFKLFEVEDVIISYSEDSDADDWDFELRLSSMDIDFFLMTKTFQEFFSFNSLKHFFENKLELILFTVTIHFFVFWHFFISKCNFFAEKYNNNKLYSRVVKFDTREIGILVQKYHFLFHLLQSICTATFYFVANWFGVNSSYLGST